ncbi:MULTISPECIES: RDD family protein [Solibacillus]|nr:RDD family protein [Solibacillus silvestris]
MDIRNKKQYKCSKSFCPKNFYIIKEFVASFIDFLIISSIFGIVFYMINGNYSIEQTEEFTFQALYTLYLTITPILWGGYVIGKKICKVKIKRFNDDEKLTILKMIIREVVGKYIILATFGISVLVSGLMVILREDKRAIHDFISGTYVNKE